MANLFGNLLDRDNPAKKIQKEIDNTEFRKQALISALQNEVQTAQQQINNEIYQIGSIVYEAHISGSEAGGNLTAHYDAIETFKKVISEKETKIKEISSRYDEEITILQSQLGIGQSQTAQQLNTPAAQGSGAACPNCGNSYVPGTDIFCADCGQKLNQHNISSSSNDITAKGRNNRKG